ncbi:MAG: nitroreductase family protein [Chloroflexi bacterium]|nr:nitroreductase family protein [Chloroflexota bacterium]
MFHRLVQHSRSYRRFDGSAAIDTETLTGLISLARLSPSAANRQPLKYVLSNTPERNHSVFETLSWAGYLKDGTPSAEERPTAYIIILLDHEISVSAGCDHGIAAQTILLGANELGLGGCMFGAVRRDALRSALNIPERYEILLVIALGRPVETVQIEEAVDGAIKYYRTADRIHHVPKRPLSEVILDI